MAALKELGLRSDSDDAKGDFARGVDQDVRAIAVLFQRHVLKRERNVETLGTHIDKDEAGRLALTGVGLENNGCLMYEDTLDNLEPYSFAR